MTVPVAKVRTMVVALLVALFTSACSETEWCESRDANALRERNVSTMEYRTIHEVLAMDADSPISFFAHRGSYHCEEMDSAPENSFANLKIAIQKGFDGYETDLWPSADGEFLIHHDETLDRTTTGTGDVTSITFAQSRQLRLTYPSGKESSEIIPTFRELLIAGGGRILFLVELKGGTPERLPELMDIARETDSLDKVFFWIDWTPEYAVLLEQFMKSGLPEIRTSVLWRTREMDALDDVLQRFDPIMVDIPPEQEELSDARGWRTRIFGVLPENHLALVKEAQSRGAKVMVSKVETNPYFNGLRKEGVRVYMSRAPDVQLKYAIDKGWHR